MIKPAAYEEIIDVLDNISFIARDFRRRHQLTLREAAEICGLSASGYNSIEKGTHEPTKPVIVLLLRGIAEREKKNVGIREHYLGTDPRLVPRIRDGKVLGKNKPA